MNIKMLVVAALLAFSVNAGAREQEPNDYVVDAMESVSNTLTSQVIGQISAGREDNDFYKIEVQPGTTTVTFYCSLAAKGDWRISVWDTNNVEQSAYPVNASACKPGFPIRITTDEGVQTPSTYYLQVAGPGTVNGVDPNANTVKFTGTVDNSDYLLANGGTQANDGTVKRVNFSDVYLTKTDTATVRLIGCGINPNANITITGSKLELAGLAKTGVPILVKIGEFSCGGATPEAAVTERKGRTTYAYPKPTTPPGNGGGGGISN